MKNLRHEKCNHLIEVNFTRKDVDLEDCFITWCHVCGGKRYFTTEKSVELWQKKIKDVLK